MKEIVVDASRIGNAILPDEHGLITRPLLEILAHASLVEPAHWPIEVANLVTKAARKSRITLQERRDVRDAIASLIRGATVESSSNAMSAFDLSIEYHISAYDAGYLELALRHGLPLLTGDGGLSAAAERAGVELVELS